MFDKKLFKFLKYLLAHHPEEFGLIPDINGFFKIKEIFQVLIFTKNFKKLKLETLKLAFSYYYRDFFEFSEKFNKVKSKTAYYSPPVKIDFLQIYNNSTLWTIVKPKIWIKISTEGIWTPKNSLIPLFVKKELAENWAKVKGALLIEVFPSKIPKYFTDVFKFGEEIFLVKSLPYEALKGPPIDNKFLRKYGPKQKVPEKEPPIIPFTPPEIEIPPEEELPFRKITHGKKKEKPWKKFQKKREKEKYG